MPMIGSFYAPGEWVQPNQRNIGDSLLDLYKMKREIENDRMQREKAQMELENERLDRATVLENAKKEREGQKIIQKALADKEVTKQGYTVPSVISGLTKGAKSLADFYGSLGTGMQFPAVPQISSALTRALGGKLPSIPTPSMQGPTTATQPVNFRDPAVQSALIRAATIAPSLRPVLDDLIRAYAGRTTEDQAQLNAQMH